MSADLDDRIRQATGDPQHELDFQQVRARAGQLRRRRLGAGTVAAAGLVAIAVVAVPALSGGGSMPTIAPDPAGSTPGPTGASEPQGSSESTTVEDDSASWRRASTGEALSLRTDAWAQPSFEPLGPSHAADWSSAAQDVLAPAIQPNPNGDDLPSVSASPHVGPGGRLLVVPGSNTGEVLVVDADGAQHMVTLPVAGWTDAVWAPAGYWFLMTRSDDAVAVHRIDGDGRVRSSEPVPVYQPDWGVILHVHADEIWVSAGFDSDPTRGPEATRLATDGGDTIVDALSWVPVDQRPETTVSATTGPADAEHRAWHPAWADYGDLPRSDDGDYAVPVDGGEVTVSLQHADGVDVDLTYLSYADESPLMYREVIATTTAGQFSQIHSTVLLSIGGSVWATGFPDVATPSGVALGPSGTTWFVRITPDGYALTELVPPTEPQSG